MKSRVLVCLVIVLLMVGVISCSKENKIETSDILTQKKTEEGKTQITVLVKYAFSINGFEKAVEEKFPDIDIIQVGNYTRDMGTEEYARRLEHDDLTDIVMTWPLDVGTEYWQERLMDLSGMEFTQKYNLSMLNSMSQNGELYYLPGPAQVRGIVYNKTLFEENGWQIPTDYEGFKALCHTIEQSGMRSLQLGFENKEVLDTAFVGYNYANFYSKPQDVQWIDNYNRGIGSFGDHFAPALDVFQDMVDSGIWEQSDLDIDYAEREQMLFSRECAMLEDSVLLTRMGYSQAGTTDEFALMPFFNPGAEGDWARIYMVCYIGLNKHLEEEKNKEKYDQVQQIMEYISTPEGQEALSSDTGAMFSSLTETAPPDIPEIESLLPALNHGRYAIFPQLKNAQSALREGLAGMVRGDMTKADVITMVDEQNQNPIEKEKPVVLGKAETDFTILDTGNFVTDAMRNDSGCDVALFMDNGKDGIYSGKGISGAIYKGDVTDVDISCVLPDIKHGETGTLWKVEMTGENLKKTLEYAIPVDNNVTGWFYYFSGLKLEYDPLKEPGKRMTSITTADEKKIEDDKLYSVAVMDETIPAEYMESCEKTEKTIQSVIEEAVKKSKTIAPTKDRRFQIPN